MAVAEQQTIFNYAATGGTVFAYSCRILDAADLRITLDGTEKTVGVDFTVSGVGAASGGSVTFSTGQTGALRIWRSIQLIRTTDYQVAGDFQAQVVNRDFDRWVMALQDIENGAAQILNSLRVPAGEVIAEIPAADVRANHLLGFDSTGEVAALVGAEADSATALDMELRGAANASEGAGQVGFVVSHAYAAGTVGRKLKERVSVLDYGAVADGNTLTGAGTDNTAVFQAAIDALGAGGVLFVPRGVFKLASQIVVPSQFTITGAGNFCAILLAPTAFNNADGLVKLGGVGGAPTIVENLGILAQTGGAGAVSCGINSEANGAIMRNLWVSGFKQNIIVAESDNFLLDSISEETTTNGTGITVTQSNVTIADCLTYHCYVGLAVSGVPFLSGPISISNVRSSACDYIGFLVDNSDCGVLLSDCSVGHNNVGRYVFAGIDIESSSFVAISDFTGRLGSGPSVAGVGIRAVSSSNIAISTGLIESFYDGIEANDCHGLTINGCQAISNARRGITVTNGDKVVIDGNTCSDNGGAGTFNSGIYADNGAAFSYHLLANNICSQTGGGPQDYGIYCNLSDNGANTGQTLLSDNICRYNAVADINLTGRAKDIVAAGNVPTGAVGSVATLTITATPYAVGYAEESIVCNVAATTVLTLPAPAANIGRQLNVKTIAAQTVTSATSNVVPLAGGAAGTAILAGTAGKWATLRCDGTAWHVMAAG